jgi:DNA-binding phage protein
VLAVPEDRCSESKPLSYKDLTPLVLKVGASWKSDDIVSAIEQNIDLKQVSYCISDTGNNLTRAFRLLNCSHIADINHKITLMIQSVFENNQLLDQYTKALSSLRAQKSMSKIARIVPPNQRIMNRFMNLTPLFKWGIKMIHLLDNNELTDEEKTALSFLELLREFADDTYQILIRLHNMQKILKNKGFSEKSAKEAMRVFSDMKSANSLKIKTQIEEYFTDLLSKAKGKTICCSSDIIESCFSKYKEIVRGNKTVGISDLCLCIAAITGENNPDKTNQAMETISIKQSRDWKVENIAKTLFAEKIELNKIIERNYY